MRDGCIREFQSRRASRFFQLARFFSVLAGEMRSVAVGWQVYEITNRPPDLGTLVVTGLWAWYFPELQRTNKLDSSAA